MRKILIALLTGALLASTPAICQAQAATEAAPLPEKITLVKRYFAAIHFEQMMTGIVNQMTPAMMAQMRKTQPNMTDAEFQAATEAVTESSNDFLKKVTDASIPVYADIFTVEELTKMDEFYETPIGQSIMAKVPEASQKLMPTVMALMPDFQADVQKRLCAKIDCSAKKTDKPAA
jgi:hypothetical protein